MSDSTERVDTAYDELADAINEESNGNVLKHTDVLEAEESENEHRQLLSDRHARQHHDGRDGKGFSGGRSSRPASRPSSRPASRPSSMWSRPASRPASRPVSRPTPTTQPRFPVAKPTKTTNPGSRFGGSSQPRHPVAPSTKTTNPGSRFGGSTQPRHPVAPSTKTTKPGSRFGGTSKPSHPVAKPVKTTKPKSFPSQKPHKTKIKSKTTINNYYGNKKSKKKYGKGSVGAAFVAGAVVGGGSMYLHNRHSAYGYHNPYRSYYYHDPYYYRSYYGHDYVFHRRYHDFDGPYYRRSWAYSPSYLTVRYDYSNPPYLPSYGRVRARPQPPTNQLSGATAVLYFHATESKIDPIVYYSLDSNKDEIRSMDESQIIALIKGGQAPNLGQLRTHLMNKDFTQLEKGLNYYYAGLTTKCKLVGVALVATIASLPDFKGNVLKAQTALEEFKWPKKKPERQQIIIKVMSAQEQASFEFQSAAKFKYEGVGAMDAISGARIGSSHLGEQGFEVKYREQVAKCNEGYKQFVDSNQELESIKADLALPEVAKEPKWDDNAICKDADNTKASELASKRAKIMETNGEDKLSTEELHQQVMRDLSSCFVQGTEKVQLRGSWVLSGIFCHGAAVANMGFCAQTSKSCDELKADCASNKNTASCEEHKDKCEFLTPETLKNKLKAKSIEMMHANSGSCTDFLDVMYTKAAVKEWFDKDAGLAVTDAMGGNAVAASSGIVLSMLETYASLPPEKTTPPSRPGGGNVPGTSPSTPYVPPSTYHREPPSTYHRQPQTNTTYNNHHPSNRSTARGIGGAIMGVIVVGVLGSCCCCALMIWWLCGRGSSGYDGYDGQARQSYDSSYGGSQRQSEAYAPEYLDFQCPPGNQPGDLVQVTLPDGTTMQVTIPQGVYGGMNFSVAV